MRELCERLIGTSIAARELKRDLAVAVKLDVAVLISGESGVGKEAIARRIHQRSRRNDAALIAINCAEAPDSLFESHLFGFVPRDRSPRRFSVSPSWLKLASGGTLLLDDVSEMGPRAQGGLFRFLRQPTVPPVGAGKALEGFDVRVIAATSSNLFDRVTRKQFLGELYYRLNVIHLKIPPLRERPEDIPELLNHFLTIYGELNESTPRLSASALRVLENYHWPGNVSELRHLAERLAVRCVGVLSAEQVRAELSHGDLAQAVSTTAAGPFGLDETLGQP